ncbi:MAG TPA: DNA polymerase III subunit delta [Candidatus Megamonas gallistercoris]|nr:DNA polymerase III subunit delta [Candidatus Megamonas gallistercoris]
MKYNEAMRQLQQKKLSSVYLIYGEETYLAEKFLKALLSLVNPQNDTEAVQYFDTSSDVKTILQSLDSSPFFSEKNIIIANDLKIFQDKLSDKDKRDEQQFIDYISSVPEYSILIMQYHKNKIDKRRKLFKTIDRYGSIVECETLNYWNINDWLNSRLRELNLRFEREAYAYFIEAVKSMDKISLGFLDQELIKLTLYTDEKFISRQILEQVFSSIPEISAFRLWDSLCDKNISLALELYMIQQSSGIHPLRLLAFLVRQVRQIWQVKIYLNEGQNMKQIASTLKLHPFITEKIIKQTNNFSLAKIERTLQNLASADYKLKTGTDEPALIENILIEFCR